MRHCASIVAAALIAALAPGNLSAGGQQTTVAGTAVVAGQVIDATLKQPVAGVVVALTTSSPAPASGPPAPGGSPAAPPSVPKRAVTNAEGRFVFRDVPAGAFSLTATRNGYSPGAIGRRRPNGPARTLTVADGGRISDAVIQVFRMPAISGVIHDDRGEPAVGVYATAMRRVLIGGRMELAFSNGEATDDRGHYRIASLEPGSYVVMARTTSQAAPVSTVERYRAGAATGTATQLARDLREGGALQMAMDGLVIDGWQIKTSDQGTIMPGPNGTVFLSPLTFYGNTGSASEATVLMLGPGDDRPGIDFTLPLVAGVRVSGTLTGLDRPAASYGVQLVPVATGTLAYPFPIAYSITDESGRFAFLGVPPGAYTARATRVPPVGPLFVPPPPGAGAAGRETVVTMPPPVSFPAMFAEAAIAVGVSHVDGVSLAFQPGAALRGRVVFDGTAAPPAAGQLQRIAVSVRSVGTIYGRTSPDTMVDASAGFQTNGYPPGRYLVTASTPGPQWLLASVRAAGVDASDQALTLGSSDVTDVVITFTDKPTTFSGSVRAADSGTDVEATVVAFPADHKSWMASGMSPRRVASAATSTSGAYQLRIELPGEYLLVAVPPDVVPDVDPEFIARFSGSATRVSITAGETKSQALTVSRVK